eukprot:355101-Chlamydomonas_euryale.AAC.6
MPWQRMSGHAALHCGTMCAVSNTAILNVASEFLLTCRILGINGLSTSDISARFRQADTDRSGGISFEEFVEFYKLIQKHLTCTHDQVGTAREAVQGRRPGGRERTEGRMEE